MARDKISEYDATAANNTVVGDVNIDEACPPSSVNNALREILSHLKEMDVGTFPLTSPQFTSITGNVIATGTVEPAGDTAAGDNAAIGYTAAEGLILTGQGSTSDLTVKNDADVTVFTVPTGTDDILFPDSAKAMWGAGSDLQIYHDGSNSYIADAAGDGNITLQSNQINIVNAAGNETLAQLNQDGAVTLYYDNAAKIATASTGISVTGDITANNFSAGNLLINGSFNVWQRGTTSSVNEYGPDRWECGGGGPIDVSQQAGASTDSWKYSTRVQRTAGQTHTSVVFGYGFERIDAIPLRGKKVTFSVYIKKGANFSASSNVVTLQIVDDTSEADQSYRYYDGGGGTSSATNNAVTITDSFVKYTVTHTVAATAVGLAVGFTATPVGTAGANDWFEIAHAQLEEGSVATSFEHVSISEELEKCKRYYQVIGGDTVYQNIVNATWYGVGDAVGTFRHHPSLRGVPTVVKSGSWATLGGAGAVSQTISGDQNGPNSIQLGFTGGSSGVTGQSTTIRVSNDANFRLSFDAEL